ncbi:MAG: FliG C-terminal domain-containing protein, partial [Bdellovibrionota bacterium]
KFEEFSQINDMIVCEIVESFKNEMRTVALALYKSQDQALVQKFMKNMSPPVAHGFKEATGELHNVTIGEQTGARYRMITKSRELESQGKFVLKKYSAHYAD